MHGIHTPQKNETSYYAEHIYVVINVIEHYKCLLQSYWFQAKHGSKFCQKFNNTVSIVVATLPVFWKDEFHVHRDNDQTF